MPPSETAAAQADSAACAAGHPPRRRPSGLLLAGVLAVTVVAAAIGSLTGGSDDAAPIPVEDPGLVHVHGLGVNPADGALYAATHTGLFRLDGDGGAERVGDRYQDTMGFTVAGPDRFIASGHPDLRDERLRVEGKPPLLGLIESTDRGRTWRAVSLLGDADLHTIVADGGVLVAYDSTGERVLASDDDGRTFQPRSSIALAHLAVDPNDGDHVIGVTPDGELVESRDGARTWTPHATAPPAGLAVLQWGDSGLWGGTTGGCSPASTPPRRHGRRCGTSTVPSRRSPSTATCSTSPPKASGSCNLMTVAATGTRATARPLHADRGTRRAFSSAVSRFRRRRWRRCWRCHRRAPRRTASSPTPP